MTDDVQRHSISEAAAVVVDPDELARREAANAVEQFDKVLALIEEAVAPGGRFRLRPSTILTLHGIAMAGIHPMAGTWRNSPVGIGGSKHVPPREHLVPTLIEDLCEWVARHWNDTSAVRLCAYVMWRLNWVHPFADGNGRTSRAAAYLVLCARVGFSLPGRKTIPEQIAENKVPYYAALEALDQQQDFENPNLQAMENLLEACLAEQLKSAFDAATRASDNDAAADRRFH